MALVSEVAQVKQKGRDFWACCPLHQEKTPSFKIDPSTQLWHCFGCGEGGGVFDLVMKLDGLSFPEAVRKLADRAHIEIEEDGRSTYDRADRNKLKEACAEAASFYHTQLMRGKSQEADSARSYLSSRGLGGDVPGTWMLGYAPGNSALVRHLSSKGFSNEDMVKANLAVAGRDGRLRDRFYKRVMFPIFDIRGECIAFGGRITEGDGPKYLNSQETPIFHKSQVLFGLDKAKAEMTSTGTAIVTEGYTDVIAMHKAGVRNAVATLGTSLTRNHVRMLSRHAGKRIVYIFDGDEAGQRATERALQFIDDAITPESGGRRIDILALCLPDGMDPAEYLDAHSADQLRELVANAKPLVLFGIERRIARHDSGTAEGRAAALTDALDVLAPIKDSILAKDYARQIAGMLRLREDDVLGELSKLKPPRRYPEQGEPSEDSRRQAERTSGNSLGIAYSGRLSAQEASRIETERELLGLCAQNPSVAFSVAQDLSSISWRNRADASIADGMLAFMMEHPAASPSELISHVDQLVPGAASLLTKASLQDGIDISDMLRFLSEELAIGDLEQELALLRESMKGASGKEAEDAFEKSVRLQSRLNDMKNSHMLPG